MMIQGAPVVLGGKKKSNVPAFAYTGKYNVRDDDVVELLESGEITFVEDGVIDVFMVGGGGKGGRCVTTLSAAYYTARGGGGGGYTRTLKRLAVRGSYKITIGEGSTAAGVDGGSTAWGNTHTVLGGKSATEAPSAPTAAGQGMAGGSGGGGAVLSNGDYGTGGSDGSNGESGFFGSTSGVNGGTGQGFTTREFGEATGKLYAGGGGGGRYMISQTPIVSNGGAGGGGTGGWAGGSSGQLQAPAAGGANTGGGGGGAVANYSGGTQGGSGGSGIVCFRKAQELPELAGTWVLNKRMYAPESPITQELNYTLSSTGAKCNSIFINNEGVNVRVVGQSGYSRLYTFSTADWGGSNTPVSMVITSTTASDEFRAWLASNATKQS